MSDPTTTPRDAGAGALRFAFVAHLDPLRTVQGSRTRYDCRTSPRSTGTSSACIASPRERAIRTPRTPAAPTSTGCSTAAPGSHCPSRPDVTLWP
jgi:hypothetical protein